MISITESNSSKVVQFDGTNFGNWKYRLGVLLDEKGLKHFIEEKLETILANDKDGKNHDSIKKSEKSCVSIIVQTISDSQLEYVKDKKSAKEMYDGLVAMFERKTVAGQLTVRMQLLTMKMGKNESMAEHFLNFDKKIRDLRSSGANVDDVDIICHLLLTLPETYGNLVTAIETMHAKDLTLDFVKSRLLDEYAKRNCGSSNGKSNETHAMTSKNPSIVCFKCGKRGHIMSRCRAKKANKSAKNDATSKKNGETANNASNDKSNNKNSSNVLCAIVDDDVQAHACNETVKRKANTESVACIGCDSVDIKFTLDSGATEHMANDSKYFNALKRMDDIPINVAKKNQSMKSNQYGDITVKTFNGDESNTKTMKDVLFVKDLKCNLMSVWKLTRHGYKVVFEGDEAIVSINGVTQFVGKVNGKLYEINFQVERNVFAGISGEMNLKHATQNLWHFRLGHLNPNDMKKLIKQGMVNGMQDVSIDDDSKFCESCVYGKQAKASFPRNKRARSKRVLELIHTDVCGPMTVPSWNGSLYFVSFIDDYSRASMIYCIEKKSDVYSKLIEFVSMAEAYHNCRVSKIKLDNGGEYSSNDLKDYCKQKGIQLLYTVPYNPEMNSVAERLNRTLVEKARSMLIGSGIDWHFWNEAIATANYLRNRSPTNAWGRQFINKTPAELWYGSKPDLSNIRIFGSMCYNQIPAEKRKKLDVKSTKCIMLGYGTSFGIFRLWDIENNKLILGRHVVFNEKAILERAKVIEIVDSVPDDSERDHFYADNDGDSSIDHGADLESTGDNMNDRHSTNTECAGDCKNKCHSTNKDCAGSSKENVNSTNKDCVGNIERNVHGVSENIGNIEPRRGTRERKQPDRYGIALADAHFALSAQDYVQNDPTSIQEAKKRSDWPQWKQAINEEYSSLMKNQTWSLCELPKGRRAISNKWVFKLKLKANGEIDKYKARLVARGDTQVEGFDYNETYSPTARLTTFRVLMSIAVQFGLHVHQLDVKSAFLNGKLNEEIYMQQPKGFEDGTSKVCKLQKSLYGLKQASRMWNQRFHDFMLRIGFKRCISDQCVYVKVCNGITCYVLLYVDDTLVISSDFRLIETIKAMLKNEFEMTDIGKIDTFLGVSVNYDWKNQKISMNQSSYLKKVLKKFNMTDCKPINTPMENGIDLRGGDPDDYCNAPYRELIGCLTYATIASRPDLAAATNYFSRFQSNFNDEHFKYAKRILRYIKATEDLNLVYKRNDGAAAIVGYTDSDYASDKNDRKSISGYVFKVFGNTVSWSSKKQTCVSQSSTEAEYVALAQGMNEGKWLQALLTELKIKCDASITIYEDNTSCISAATNAKDHKRMKQIDVEHHYIRDEIAKGTFKLEHIQTGEQTADIMTKGLSEKLFVKHRFNLSLQKD